MKRLLLLPMMLVSLLLLIGCGAASPATSDSTPAAPTTTSTTSRPACQGLATIDNALTRLSKAGDNITIGEVKTLQAQISLALNVVGKLVPSDLSSTVDQLKAANDQIGQAVTGLPDGDTLAEHGPQLQKFREQVANAQDAASRLATRLNCTG